MGDPKARRGLPVGSAAEPSSNSSPAVESRETDLPIPIQLESGNGFDVP